MKKSVERKLCLVLCLVSMFIAAGTFAQTNQSHSISTSVLDGIGGATNGAIYNQPVGSGAQPGTVGISGSANYRNYAGYLYTIDTLTAQGGDITLTLDEPLEVQCDEEWTEAGVMMWSTHTKEEDACPAYCSFGFVEGYLGLWPGRLEVDLSGIHVARVEIDFDNWCPDGCTRVFLYQGGEILDQNHLFETGPVTVELNANSGMPTLLGVSSCEAAVLEIRLISSGPSVHPSDRDGDAVTDSLDNCPDAFNPGQEDSDANGIGDVCEGVRGDVDGNGSINVLDVLAVVNDILGIVPLQGSARDWADCNGDGQINVLDALSVVNVILYIIPECPGGGAKVEVTAEALTFLEGLKPYLGEKEHEIFMGLVSKEMAVEVPTEFTLFQNYPNPFNPITTISYTLPVQTTKSKVEGEGTLDFELSTSYVTLKIFNVLGQEVATLVDETKKPGYYMVTWDASQMSSGVYFYRLTAGEFVATKRMLLVR